MPDALIHIGMPKTGTSAIQSWLRVNADALRSRGVLFDGFGDRLKTPVQHELGFGLLAAAAAGISISNADVRRRTGTQTRETQRRVVAKFASRFAESVRKGASGIYVISSEWISGSLKTVKAVQQFDAQMRRHFDEITYLVYLRDQAEWTLSSYSQHVRHGGAMSLDEYRQQFSDRDYNNFCANWAEGTNDTLQVRLLEPHYLKDADLIADFAAALDVNPDGMAPPQRRNSALSARSIRLWRQTNAFGARYGLERPVRHLRTAWCNSSLAGRGQRLAFTPIENRQIAQTNAHSNAALRARWFPDHPVLFQNAHRALTQPPADQSVMNSQRRNARWPFLSTKTPR